MSKKVTVWVESHPLAGENFSEALRMSVGLTIAGNSVTVILSEYPPSDFEPEKSNVPDHKLHLQTLQELGVQVLSISGGEGQVQEVSGDEVKNILNQSDFLIFY